jgi:HEAT repeat protein/beta-lactamase regulating signal transducer with metallopeptidase domain
MRTELIPILGSWLLTYLLHSTLLLGGAWLMTRRLIQSAAIRELVWKAAMLGGLATAMLQVGLGFVPLGGAVALELGGGAKPAVMHTGRKAAVRADAWQGLLPAEETFPNALEAPVTSGRATPSPESPAGRVAESSESASTFPLLLAALCAWGTIGLALCGLYLVQRARAMRRIGPRRQVSDVALLGMLDGLRRVGKVRRVIRLTAAEGLPSPVALGDDEIALPEAALTDLDPEQQRSMLAHELAHLERRDPMWLALGCVIERAMFVQPLNRIARIRLQEAAEYLCDDWAVHRTGSGVSLATCLVKVAEWVDTPPRAIPLAGMAERRSQLVTRIHRLIEGRVMPASPRSFWLLAGAVTLVGLTAIAAPGITTARDDLQAQDTVAATKAPEPDSSAGWYRRLAGEMRIARSRASADMRRAMADARAAMVRIPRPPEAPRPPRTPVAALAPIAAANLDGALARAPRGWGSIDEDRRQDTTSIAVPALIEALRDGDIDVRRAACNSLSNLEDRRAIPALIDVLKDGDAEVRACAARALGSFDDKRALPGLVALLKDKDKDVRESALSSLEGFRDQVPASAIITALGDEDPDIRVAAIGLAECECEDEKRQDPQIVQKVVELVGHPNADVRAAAISVLPSFHLKEAPAGLLAGAKDKNPDVRQRVAEALGSIHDPRSVPALSSLLADGNADVRESAVNALSEIRDRSALEALVGALKSSDPVVRRSAAEALGQRQEEQ